MKFGVLTILIAASLVVAQSAMSRTPVTKDSEDDRIVGRVKDAVAKKIDIDQLEKSVGQPTTIDTQKKEVHAPIESVDIILDSTEKSDIARANEIYSAKRAVYWIRPVKSKNPKAVGVALTRDGEMKVFFIEVLPPH